MIEEKKDIFTPDQGMDEIHQIIFKDDREAIRFLVERMNDFIEIAKDLDLRISILEKWQAEDDHEKD